MRNIFLFTIFICAYSSIWAQDVIVTNDNNRINAQVLEQNMRLVKYKMLDHDSQPIIEMQNSKIKQIEYETGLIHTFYSQNPRKNRPFGFSIGGAAFFTGNSGMGLLSIDYFIIPQLSFEANIGVVDFDESYYAIGAKIHLNSSNSTSRFTPFSGLLFGSEYGDAMVQIPVGVCYISEGSFFTSFSLNQLLYFDSYSSINVELKIGFRFKV